MPLVEQPASDIVVAQAIPHLMNYLPNANWTIGQTPETFLSFSPEWEDKDPVAALQSCFPDLASPYALFGHEYLAFVKRDVVDREAVNDYYDIAHRITIDGFRKQREGSWMYYTPEESPPKETKHRTYISVPSGKSSIESMMSVSSAIGRTLNRPGIQIKTSRDLKDTHSVVIYSDGSNHTRDALDEFVDVLQDEEVTLASETILTALPVIPGIANSPEVPNAVQEYYRTVSGQRDDGLSWTQLIGRSLLVSTQYALRDHPIINFNAQLAEITAQARAGAGPYFATILNSMGIDPASYQPTST